MNKIYSKARISKDKNFDGEFFFAVKTTGIFCRPSCPAPVAKEQNVEYFTTVFEAIDKGYRPCLRCRPDIEVAYSNGNIDGTSIVDMALNLIYSGYLNEKSLSDLAKDLLVSDRHLRKLFVDNLALPPIKVAKYHKALFSKKLLISSDQTITDIAFASGFNSIRQFNDVFKTVFGMSPSKARKEFTKKNPIHSGTKILLKYQKPFDFKQMLSFMRPRAIEGIEVVKENSFSRTFRYGNTKGVFIVTDIPEQSSLALNIISDDVRCYMEIYNRIRKMFDLNTDFKLINKVLSKDKLLAEQFLKGYVPRLPVAFNPFEFTVRAILGQQISVKAATSLASRIAKAANLKNNNRQVNGLDYFFPNPSEILNMDLTNLGITKTRQQTIKSIAQYVKNKSVRLFSTQTFDNFSKDFKAIKGVGDWTVNYVAMRGLGMMDAFPYNDLGIIKSLTKENKVPTKKEILKISEKWRPYRAYAALCLWNFLSKEEK